MISELKFHLGITIAQKTKWLWNSPSTIPVLWHMELAIKFNVHSLLNLHGMAVSRRDRFVVLLLLALNKLRGLVLSNEIDW